MTEPKHTTWWGPIAVATGAALWGIETLFRVNLQKVFSSDILVFYEHVLASALCLPILLAGIKGLKLMTWRAFGWLLVSSILGSSVGTIFFTASLQKMNITVANVLLNLQPIVSVTCAWLFLKETLAPHFILWAALAILAGMLLSFENISSFQLENPMGLLYVCGTIFCWGIATVAGRGLMITLPLSVAAPLRFLIGIAGSFFIVTINGNSSLLASQGSHLGDWMVIQNYFWLLIVAGATPLFIYFYGLKYTKANAGAFCEMAQTLAALILTWVFMGVPLKSHQILASVLLVISVTKVNLLQAKLKS